MALIPLFARLRGPSAPASRRPIVSLVRTIRTRSIEQDGPDRKGETRPGLLFRHLGQAFPVEQTDRPCIRNR